MIRQLNRVSVAAAASLAAIGVTTLATTVPAQAHGTRVRAADGTPALVASHTKLTGFVCRRALRPIDRSISATAVIRPISGTVKLAVNFRLLRRSPTGVVINVHGAGLGTWLTKSIQSRPQEAWRVIHTVSYLSAPATYRLKVSYRWVGAGGRVIAHGARRSRRCRQPELRPNLEVQSIAVGADATDASDDYYLARIYDAGATGAGPFLVQLADQEQLVNRRVRHIRRHELLSVRLAGPLCDRADPPTVTVDPYHRVDVYSRARASLTATCPASTAGSSTG